MAAVGGPTAAAAAAGADTDLQAVESIPRDTLIALLKRKNKDAKAVQAKLDKLEERYVKVVRFNRILMEDRTSFQRFCGELLPESDATFEEAAAQESPVNSEALLRQLTAWRSAFDAAKEDRRTFQQFIELIFPGDEAMAQVFERSSLSSEAFDLLQQRWITLEDLHNQSIASVNAMSREQMLEGTQKLDAANAARQEAERKVEEMREQLTQMAREKAQMLRQKLQGNSAEPVGDIRADGPAPAPGFLGVSAPATAALSSADARELEDLREGRRAAERREREAQEAAEARQRELLDEAEAQRAEVRRVRRELESLREEGERYRAQVRQLVEEKDALVDRLQQRIVALEEEASGNAFITQCAEQQAGREVELKTKERQIEQLNLSILESQRLLTLNYEQERVLKSRIRELESSHGREHTAGDYLKHVVLKYVQYSQAGDMKAQTLVPVLCTLLRLSPEEIRSVESPALPQSLLLINQAVGGASSWLRGGSAADGDSRSLNPDALEAG